MTRKKKRGGKWQDINKAVFIIGRNQLSRAGLDTYWAMLQTCDWSEVCRAVGYLNGEIVT